jgi:hypothetical protein
MAQETAPAAATEVSPLAAAPAPEPRLILRKLLFVIGTLALMAAYALFRHKVQTNPLYSSLVVSGVWAVVAVAGLWFLGRDKRPMLRAWRIFMGVCAIYLMPLLLNIGDGLAEHGWPQGRFNRQIAQILSLLIPLVAPIFVTGLVALIRLPRVAGVLAILSGASSIVLTVYLIPASKAVLHLSITLGDVLNNVMFVVKLENYAGIPMGVAFVVGGILMLLGARKRVAA